MTESIEAQVHKLTVGPSDILVVTVAETTSQTAMGDLGKDLARLVGDRFILFRGEATVTVSRAIDLTNAPGSPADIALAMAMPDFPREAICWTPFVSADAIPDDTPLTLVLADLIAPDRFRLESRDCLDLEWHHGSRRLNWCQKTGKWCRADDSKETLKRIEVSTVGDFRAALRWLKEASLPVLGWSDAMKQSVVAIATAQVMETRAQSKRDKWAVEFLPTADLTLADIASPVVTTGTPAVLPDEAMPWYGARPASECVVPVSANKWTDSVYVTTGTLTEGEKLLAQMAATTEYVCGSCGHRLTNYDQIRNTWWCGSEMREVNASNARQA